MQVVSFIKPAQPDVIEEILKHCSLWQSRSPSQETAGVRVCKDTHGRLAHTHLLN